MQLDGHDVLAVSSTGFGKSSIFQVFVIAAEMEGERSQTALVLCPSCRFHAEFLEFFLTRGLRWGVEAHVGRPLLDFRLIITRDFDLYFFNLT